MVNGIPIMTRMLIAYPSATVPCKPSLQVGQANVESDAIQCSNVINAKVEMMVNVFIAAKGKGQPKIVIE